ncbi:MAG: AIR synthase family protein [Anaerolineales bacterium]
MVRPAEPFPLGKIPNPVLRELLTGLGAADPRVRVGPGIGLDAAVIDLGDRYLVAKTDPITFASDWVGWYAVQVNANDVACMGAEPRWFLASLLLPEGKTDRGFAETIFNQIGEACRSLKVSLVGGHTEISHGIDRPIVVGCMLGEVAKDGLVTAAGARAGDVLLLVGGIPIEATAILAREKAAELEGRFEPQFLERCRNFLFEPGISVVRAVRLALPEGPVHSMHDLTEGGLLAGLWELAEASGCGLEVNQEAIPVLPEGQALCEAFGLNPLASIASGALLLTAPSSRQAAIEQALTAQGIVVSPIGQVISGVGAEVRLRSAGEVGLAPKPERDEIARLLQSPK